MTSPATSGRQLSKFEKRPKMLPVGGSLELNSSGAAFCLAQAIGGLSCFFKILAGHSLLVSLPSPGIISVLVYSYVLNGNRDSFSLGTRAFFVR